MAISLSSAAKNKATDDEVPKLAAAEGIVGSVTTGSEMKFNFVNYAESNAAKLVYRVHQKSFSTPAGTGQEGRRRDTGNMEQA